MEHWSPDKARADETPGPRDVWVAWLMREPAHDVEPEHRRIGDWAGAAMMGGVGLFWAATAGMIWHAFG